MKKWFVLCLALLSAAALALSGCAGEAEGADADTQAMLKTIMEEAKAALGDVILPMTLDTEITADNSEGLLGLTGAQLEQYVMEAYSLNAAIMTHAFELALLKCNDAAAAAEVKKLIAEHFNPMKWICVIPEECFVVESGRFVLFGAVPGEAAESFRVSFDAQLKGKMGTVNTFYEKGDAEPEAGGGLGGALLLP